MIAWSGLDTGSGVPAFAAAFWKSGVVLGAALGACVLLRKKSADLRRLVLAISVVAMFAAAAVVPAMPHWTAAVPAWLQVSTSTSSARWGQPPGPVTDRKTEFPPAQGLPAAVHLPSPKSRMGVLARLPDRVPVLPLVWIAGAGILLARFLVGLCQLRRLRIASYPLSDDGLLARLGGPGHGRRVSLLESETIGAPVTWGILRPIILVPARFQHLSAEHRIQVLCHELAHIQGHDFLLRVLAEVARAVLWFQPLMWIARRQLREEQELACDDHVVAAGGKSSTYAKLLLDWDDTVSGRDALVAVGMAQRSCLKRRLYALLDLDTRRGTASRAAMAGLWFAGLATALPVAAVNFADAPVPRPRAEPVFHAATLEPRSIRSSMAAAPRVAMAGAAPDEVPQVQAAAPPSTKGTYEFEAVSIKPAPPDDGRNMVTVKGGPGTADPGQFTGLNITLRWLVGTAYPGYYRIDGPAWLDSAHYDIIAKVPPGTTKDQFGLMIQSLLEERAALRAHQEMREFPTFDLIVAKGGLKLTEAKEDPQAQAPGGDPVGKQGTKLDAEGWPQLDRPGILIYNFYSAGEPVSRLVAKDQSISSLAKMLRSATQAQVTDKTGLEGKYDFRLEYAYESSPAATPAPDGLSPASPPNPGIFSAIKSLGLALEPTKSSLGVLVIDHIDRVLKSN